MNWPRLPDRPTGNRAVTSFFKVFGGNPRLVGEAIRRADDEGHHRLEWRVLSVLVPLVAGAAIFDGLWRLAGPLLAWLGVLPIGFALLHFVAFVVGGGTPLARWWRWNVMLSAWSIWQIADSSRSGVEWAAWLWIALLLLNVFGGLGLGWRRLMTHSACCTITCRWLIWVLVHIPAALLWWWKGWQWGAWFLFGVGVLWSCGTFLPNAVVFGPVVRRMEGKGVLLTFDDGPDPEDTPVILDLLDEYGQKAVFFVIGEKVRRFPELAREIVKRGHELGNHTMTHPVGFFWGAGSIRTCREITECNRAIEEVTGVKPRWFRAPAGHRNWFTHPVLRELGLELMGWQKRAYDTIRSDVDGIVRCLTKGARDGDILLLHEATPTGQAVAKQVLELVAPKKPADQPARSSTMR